MNTFFTYKFESVVIKFIKILSIPSPYAFLSVALSILPTVESCFINLLIIIRARPQLFCLILKILDPQRIQSFCSECLMIFLVWNKVKFQILFL